jgi:hypothetical protein
MAVKFFPRDTNVDTTCDLGVDTDGDLSETQGSSAQIDSAAISSDSYRDVFSFDIDSSSGYNRTTGTFDTSLDVVASTEVDYRIIIRSVDDSGCGETDQDTGPLWTGNSIQTDTTGSITWPAADERLRMVVQAKRQTGLHGNKTLSINVNDADTFCQANAWTAIVGASPVIQLRQPSQPWLVGPKHHPALSPKFVKSKTVTGPIRYYAHDDNDDTNCDPGELPKDLRQTPGDDNVNTDGTTFSIPTPVARFDINVTDHQPAGGQFHIEFDIVSITGTGTPEVYFELGGVTSGCAYILIGQRQGPFTTGGVKTYTAGAAWMSTWNRLALRVLMTSSDASSVLCTVRCQGTTFIDAPFSMHPGMTKAHTAQVIPPTPKTAEHIPPAKFHPVIPVVTPAVAANPVIPLLKGQWLGDKLPGTVPPPQFIPKPRTPDANPGIPWRIATPTEASAHRFVPLAKYYPLIPAPSGAVPPPIPQLRVQVVTPRPSPIGVGTNYYPLVPPPQPAPAPDAIAFIVARVHRTLPQAIEPYQQPKYLRPMVVRAGTLFTTTTGGATVTPTGSGTGLAQRPWKPIA